MDLNLWKNKDELKKFLDNLGTEYRYGCFEENNPETCHLLGDYLLSIDKARSKAGQVYKNNCNDNKFGLSCDAYGRLAFRGQGMEGPDIKMALEYFIKGCDLNDPRACYHGGQMLGVMDKKVNEIVPPNPEKSIEMLKKSCLSGKQPQACTLVHSFYLRGVHGKLADLKKAADFALIACDQNEYMGCFNLSKMYELGDGVSVDKEKCHFYRERAKEITRGIRKKLHAKKDSTPDI